MSCFYCDKIKATDPSYSTAPARFDLGSQAPRCPKHWRYLCSRCGSAHHFMSIAYCPTARRFFCSGCATSVEQQPGAFWDWQYYFNLRSPWSDEWVPALDRAECCRRPPASF